MSDIKMESQIHQIFLDDIIPNRFQPRLNFDEKAMEELASSIKEHGVIQPLVLRRLADNKYEIIAGERRYKASKMAGLQSVPAVIADIDDNKSAEVALVENVQRKDLTPIEEAKSYKALLDKGYLTQEQLAKKIGISQPSIANKLRLLNLTDEVQNALLKEQISERHARSLLLIEDKDIQVKLLNRILNERLTVKQLDEIISADYKESTEQDEVPVVNLVPDIEEIKNNSIDIADVIPSESLNPTLTEFINSPSIPEEIQPVKEEPSNQNKFFNFLESESANMNADSENIPEKPKETFSSVEIVNPNTPSRINPIVEQQKNVEPESNIEIIESEPNPFLTTNNPLPKEDILDPVSLIDSIDETKEEITEKPKNISDAIGVVREAKSIIEDMGFVLDIEEADLDNQYQFTIRINKD